VNFDIEEYAKSNLERVRLTGTGQITAECPWCFKWGGFYIDIETGKYICHKCEERGRSVTGIIAQVEGVSWHEAAAYILKREVEWRRKETPESLLERIQTISGRGEPAEAKEIDVPVPEEFVPVYKGGKWKYPVYLKERGIKKSTARQWGLGFCNRGRYYGRIIIPIECPNGCSFTSRDTTGVQHPKYLNPKGVDHGPLLLGWNHVELASDVALVEGPMDAIKMWQHGIPALAVMGKYLHAAQLRLLFRKPPDTAIVVMLDPEEVTAPYDMATQLVCRFDNVQIAKLSDGVDPGSATKTQAEKAYNDALAYDGSRAGPLAATLSASRKKMSKIYQ